MFEFIGGALCVDFSNTLRMVDGHETDLLPTAEDFRRWALEAGIGEEGDPLLAPEPFVLVKALRDAFNRFLRDVACGADPASAITEINRHLAAARYGPLLESGPQGPVIHPAVGNPDAKPIEPILASLVDLVSGGSLHRLRACENTHCILVFVDQSRGGRRRWCSMATCGNREKSHRHYRRMREAFREEGDPPGR